MHHIDVWQQRSTIALRVPRKDRRIPYGQPPGGGAFYEMPMIVGLSAVSICDR